MPVAVAIIVWALAWVVPAETGGLDAIASDLASQSRRP